MKYLIAPIIALLISCGDTKTETQIADNTAPVSAQDIKEQSIARGKAVYDSNCVSCHLSNGSGVAGIYPPVANSDWIMNKRTESIKGIKNGLKGPIVVNGEDYDNIMSKMGLTNKEVADVMNYVSYTMNEYEGEALTAKDVQKALAQ